jgi:ABC-2 type transport system permease protein
VEFVYLRGLGGRLFIAITCLTLGTLAFAALGFSIPRLWGAMTLAIAGNVIHYQIGAILATTAFLWEEAYSVLMVKNMLVQLLSGELLPLSLFPVATQWIWKSTPFYLYVFGPTEYALGRWTHADFTQALMVALLWMTAFALLIRLTWGWGIRRYLSLGG